MKIHIFNTDLKGIPEKENPAFINEESLMITPVNTTAFKLGKSKFLITKVKPFSKGEEEFTPFKEVAICPTLSIAKVIAILIAERERNNFVIH